MGLFQKLFKGPEIDMEKSNANAKKMRALFDLSLIHIYTALTAASMTPVSSASS